MIKKLCGYLFIMLFFINITACGFHLKHNYLTPYELSTLHFTSSDKYSELSTLIVNRLKQNNIKLVEANENIPILEIKSDELSRSILSLYSTGTVAEYELTYIVTYNVIMPNQVPQKMQVEIRRDYLDDPTTALAKSRERDLLLKEMRRESADKIVRSLTRVKIDANLSKSIQNN